MAHARKQDKETHVGLFPTGISLLHVHGLIQKEKIIVSINPSCKKNLINVNLAKKMQVPAKHMEHTQVNNEQVQVYKGLKISVDKYVLHSNVYASDLANEDVVLGYPCMEPVGNININVQKKFLKLWYKKKKITLHGISINKQVESKEAEVEDVPGTDISDDEPLMVNNQTKTSNQVAKKQVESKEVEAENVTSDEDSVVEVIFEDKKQQQAPHHVLATNQAPSCGELKKDTLLINTSTYHHPHHPARKQPTSWKPISHNDNNPRMTDREEQRSTYYTSTQKSRQG